MNFYTSQPNTKTKSVSDVDESPFETYANTASFALYLEPIRNTYNKTYQNIITLSGMPPGPLEQMVSQIHPPKLSEFQPTTNGCMYALMRYPRGSRNHTTKNEHAYMGARDIPAIYGYLKANGYNIDTRLTKMTFESTIDTGTNEHEYSGNRKLICMVDAPP